MSEGIDLRGIAPGTPVYGADGQPLGPVEATEAGGIRVLGRTVPPEAVERVDGEGVRLRLVHAAFAAAPATTGRADAPSKAGDAAGERVAVPLAEERLVVGTRQVQTGEVAVERRVVAEQVMVPVTVRREEVEIIRRAPGEPREEIDDPSIVEVIRIPLRGEEAVVTAQPVVAGEVAVERAVRTEEATVTGTVRATEVTVEERLNEAFARLRPTFEAHFAERQRTLREVGAGSFGARDFRDDEPHYRAGFLAGRDPRHAGRTFEEVEPVLRTPARPTEQDPGLLERIREAVREGFARARHEERRR